MTPRTLAALALLLGVAAAARATPQDDGFREPAAQALRSAVRFFHRDVATEGGYVWRYSEDLSLREGEGTAGKQTLWVQPPGTPAVGLALLEAWEATGERTCLEAARDAARALVRGQLRSGGWTYRLELEPAARQPFAYRVDPERPRQRNMSTLDDNTTQSALLLLLRVDRALEFQDDRIHEAARYGLEALLQAQLPSGGFPQGFDGPTDPARHPARAASYPETWSRTVPPRHQYWRFATLNDGLLGDVVTVLLEAQGNYDEPRYRAAAAKVGDFLILAQMPDPQPGWAQQYDFAMQPTWARKFEPPAITGGEAQDAMATLLELCRATGEQRFLEPLPRALAYYRSSLLPDGRLARFYELRTNRPLYFTRDYALTYRDDDPPRHYGFQVGSRLEAIAREYQRLAAPTTDRPARPHDATRATVDRLRARAREVVAALDDRGRWLAAGRLRSHPGAEVRRVIECSTFIANLGALSRYLAATRRRV